MKLILLLLAFPAFAADLSISARVDRSVVALNEQVQLEVEVRGGSLGLPDPQLPSLPNFSVFSSGRSQNISMINGQVTSSLVFTYVLVPRFVGKAVIAPITVEEGGQTVGTDPIEIQVTRPAAGSGSSPPAQSKPAPGGAQPQAREEAPDLFVEASVDKKRVYVNEQVTLSVRFYTAVTLMGNPDYAAPETTGFFSEDLPPLRNYQKTLHGRLYYVTELKTALFPVSAGRHGIGAAVIRAQVQERMNPNAPDFFQRFFQFGQGGKPIEIRSAAMHVDVEPLPDAGRPKDFNGAVGRYNISAILSRSAVKVGDAVDLALIVEGQGNLKTVFAPKLPEMRSFRVYDTLSSMSLRKENDLVQGAKTFKTVLVPRASGKLTIPAIAFSYLNPSNGRYETKTVGPLELKVEPGDAGPATPAGPLARGPRGAVAVEADVQHILTDTLAQPWTSALAAFGRLGAAHAAPAVVWLAAVAIFGLRQRRQSRDPLRVRFDEALGRARVRLERARHSGDAAPAVLREAIAHYLADKLGVSANGLTLKQASALLRERAPQLSGSRLGELKGLWEELDALHYAPAAARGGAALEELKHRIEALLDLLEREVRR